MKKKESETLSRKQFVAGVGVAGIGLLTGSTLFGSGEKASASAAGDYSEHFIVCTWDEFGVSETNPNNTAAFNSAILAAKTSGKKLLIPPGVYKTVETINLADIEVEAAPGAIIEHYPPNDTTDCIAIIGTTEPETKRTIIKGLTIKGMQNNHPYGRALIRVGKGDYVHLMDVDLVKAKSQAFQCRPTAGGDWIENLMLFNVKVHESQEDGFHLKLSGTVTEYFKPFINQCTFINCETRKITRHSLLIENNLDSGNTACKISNIRFINCEFGVNPGADAIIRIKGGPNSAPVENISIEDSAIECTAQPSPMRTGAGVLITGRMAGKFNLENSIIYGTAGGGVIGYEQFDHFQIRNANSQADVPLLTSHEGLLDKIRTTAALAKGGGHADVRVLQAGEVLSVDVLERYNIDDNQNWYGYFRTSGKYVRPIINNVNVDATTAAGQSLFISAKCATSGNVTVTLNGTPFAVSLDAAIHTTPDLVADEIAKFSFTGFRALRSGKQSIAFTKADGLAPTIAVNYGATGVTGSTSEAALLRVLNTNPATNAILEIFIQRPVKDTGN